MGRIDTKFYVTLKGSLGLGTLCSNHNTTCVGFSADVDCTVSKIDRILTCNVQFIIIFTFSFEMTIVPFLVEFSFF